LIKISIEEMTVRAMKRNLLIVEDDPKIRKLLFIYFRDEGFNILEAETGEDAIHIFSNEKIDLVILDIMLPEVDGLRVCEVIREHSDVPVSMSRKGIPYDNAPMESFFQTLKT
jgi:DNA-binding response OmpR family regulator